MKYKKILFTILMIGLFLAVGCTRNNISLDSDVKEIINEKQGRQ